MIDFAARAQLSTFASETHHQGHTARVCETSRRRGQPGQLAQVQAEAGGRTRAPEGPAHLIVAPAQCDRVGVTSGIGGEDDAA
jgi:hypothetical protein